MRQISGMLFPYSSNHPMTVLESRPISWAMARVWMTQLVEPPVAIRTMMALRMASGVRISREVMPFNTIRTAASPERSAARMRSL